MITKTDKRAVISRKRKYASVKHGIGAHKNSFIHCEKSIKNKKRKRK